MLHESTPSTAPSTPPTTAPSSHVNLTLSKPDVAVCVMFLLATATLGLVSGSSSKRSSKTVASSNNADHDHHHDEEEEAEEGTRKEDDAQIYFTGGRKQNCVVVSLSMLSGLTSGISYLGCPGLAFSTGMMQLSMQLGSCLSIPFITLVLIPFYWKSNVSTLYEYLDLRYGTTVRMVASLIFVLRTIMYLSIVLLAPSIVVEIFHIHQQTFILVVGLTSTMYTAKGGLSSVLSTDALQSVALTIVMLIILTSLLSSNSGGQTVNFREYTIMDNPATWEVGLYGPMTVWSGLVSGLTATAAQCGADQIAVQRYLSVRNLGAAQKTAVFGVVSAAMFTSFQIFTGCLLASYYHSRRPMELKEDDQILPFYVGTEMSHGAVGACLAALTGCTMSVMSGKKF